MNLLEVKNICKTYGSGETAVKALKDVSFSVPKGEYVAVVGESGSGKSTLLNMIGALDTPTTGKVLIDGKDRFAMDERKLTAAELSRQTGIDAGILRKIMTGRETAVSTRNLITLARYFGLSMQELIDAFSGQ